MNELGKRLRDARNARGLTQKDLARKSGVSQATISDIERGRNESSKELPALAMALGVSVDALVTGRSDTAPLSLPATSSSSPKLLRLIRSLESLEQSAGLPPELVDALQKTVDAFSKRSLEDDDSEGR
jgi:transcriptional regulator with XRE-family HTH domain